MDQFVLGSPMEWLTPLARQSGNLARQLAGQLRRGIGSGALQPGDRLPASRVLAAELGVARGTVITALESLVAEGVLEARLGAGTFVSQDCAVLGPSADPAATPARGRILEGQAPDVDPHETFRIDFRPCRPSLERFPHGAWSRCAALAAARMPSPDYGNARGSAELREQLVSYLRRARGMSLSTDQIMITNGAVHAMHLVARVTAKPGERVVVENPGYPLARQAFSLTGARLLPVDVDDDGLCVNRLPDRPTEVRLVAVTPSHQFPTGGRLSLRRRSELVRWAIERQAWILEDDYDGEFRYDVPPLPPMVSMAPECVVYCGTFSKTLYPDLRLGYAVAPKQLIDAMASYRTMTEYCPPAIGQDTLRHFLRLGHYEQHVQRMRRIYGRKRQRVSEILQSLDCRTSGLDSGLSVLVDVAEDAESLAKRARASGIAVVPLTRYGITTRNALVIGYAAPSLADIEEGLRAVLSD